MKFRTDFVTNSSSSSFCVMSIELKNGNEIHWEDECCRARPIFQFSGRMEEKLKEICSVNDLVDFLTGCAKVSDMEKEFLAECKEFIASIRSIDSIDNIASLKMTWGEFLSDQGFSPNEGCDGGQLTYQFDSGKCEIVHEPDEEFIDMMNDMFCCY